MGKRGEGWKAGGEGRGRREGMEKKGTAHPNDISDTHRPTPTTGTNRGGKLGREMGSESDSARRRGMARERPERMVPGRVAETEF